jgi:UDP-N-acetylglucosamine--N-acetylmuramyl-(pentapeptide) pyrophosphoryl-undecaprenol N-acetylglucosamine transferase
MRQGNPILLAAGGTGGHLFPAEALARELIARGLRPALVTDGRGAAFPPALGAVETFRVRAGGVASGGTVRRIKGILDIAFGTLQARTLVKRLSPRAVVGFGGYASVPAVYAAARIGIPTMIHEQNAVLGRANRFLAPRARRIATSFDTVAHIAPADRAKVHRTGNPVRPEIAALAGHAYAVPAVDGPCHLLVTGGSQGASIFGRIVPPAVALLAPALRARLRIVQQCRAEDLERVETAYRALGVSAVLRSFFDDMPLRLAWTHLALCRAGASTVAELSAVGVPAILVPYPHATDDHQTANAKALDAAGGVWILPEQSFTPERLAAELAAKLDQPVMLGTAALCLRAAGRPNAAQALADEVVALLRDHASPREAAA